MSATTPAKYVDAFFDFYVGGSLDESKVLSTVREVTGRPPRIRPVGGGPRRRVPLSAVEPTATLVLE